MSHSYLMICLDCGESLHLGKVVSVRYQHRKERNLGFNSLTGYKADPWVVDTMSSEMLQHFLVRHRLHEMRTLPMGVEDYVGDWFSLSFPVDDDEVDAFFSADVGDPDPDNEVRNLPQYIIEKLRKN